MRVIEKNWEKYSRSAETKQRETTKTVTTRQTTLGTDVGEEERRSGGLG